MEKYIVGTDVGGTFTDFVAVNLDTEEIMVGKAATTPENQTIGVMQNLSDKQIKGSKIKRFFHCFTVGINTLLTRSGVKTALLATEGFEDEPDSGKIWRDWNYLYDPTWVRPHQERPIVPKRYRLGIKQRTKYDGSIFLPLDEDDSRHKVNFLKSEGVESVAISFVNSYIDLSDEKRVAEIVKEIMPDAYVQTSEIRPVSNEYPRMMTVMMDAYIGPIVNRYLDALEKRLRHDGYKGDVLIMQMTGGYNTKDVLTQHPVFALESGPVSGLLGAKYISELVKIPNIVTFDMGGTSTDVGIIKDGDPVITDEWQVEHDIPLYLPVLDVSSIGAGGGSDIYVDEMGVPHVGPDSVGADPGPACYDRGGTRAALTDAYVVMGLIRPEGFLEGKMKLRPDLSERVLKKVADKLETGVRELAADAYVYATAQIEQLIRSKILVNGINPSDTALLAIGSAGPMHGADVARQLGMPEVIVPLYPGCFSASSLLHTDLKVSHSKSLVKSLTEIGPGGMNEAFRKTDAKCYRDLDRQGCSREEVNLERVYYGMYTGQSWDVRFPAPLGEYTDKIIADLRANFDDVYQEKFGYQAPELPIIITTVESVGYGPVAHKRTAKIKKGAKEPLKDAIVSIRDLFMHKTLIRDVPFYDRRKLLAGNIIEGPAIIEEGLATTVLPEGDILSIDENGLMRIKVKPL